MGSDRIKADSGLIGGNNDVKNGMNNNVKNNVENNVKSYVNNGRNPRPPRGLFGLGRLKYDAWRTETECAAELRILDCRHQLAEKRQAIALSELNGKLALAQAEMDGRARLLRQALEAEEMEGELAFHRELRQAPPQRRLQILGAEVETQRLLLERDRLRRERLSGAALPPMPPTLPAPTGAPPGQALLEQHVGDRQVEALALRAVTRFASLAPSEAEREWARWRQELSARLPAYAAEEVARRADELRGLAG